MKKNKIAAAYKNNINYKTVYSIDEEVKYVMRTNRFVGDHVGAITKDGEFFTEREARILLMLDTNTNLVKNGVGHFGNNLLVMGFKNKLSLEAKRKMAEGLMNID